MNEHSQPLPMNLTLSGKLSPNCAMCNSASFEGKSRRHCTEDSGSGLGSVPQCHGSWFSWTLNHGRSAGHRDSVIPVVLERRVCSITKAPPTKFFHMQSPRVPLIQVSPPPPPASEKWAGEHSACHYWIKQPRPGCKSRRGNILWFSNWPRPRPCTSHATSRWLFPSLSNNTPSGKI